MLKKAALSLFLLITAAAIAILAIAGTRPAAYHVERSISTSASPGQVYALVNNMHRFPDWSPWQKLDPAMKTEFAGPVEGAGAKYHWVGNKAVGEGRMTITDSEPVSHVMLKLEFLAPFTSVNDVRYGITPEGAGSRLTWGMDGTNNYMAKVMTLFMSMDSMMGKDFEAGLANLKSIVEAEAAVPVGADSTAARSDSTAARKP
jgi:hypothetical protein